MDGEPNGQEVLLQNDAPALPAASLHALFAQGASDASSDLVLDIIPIGVIIHDARGAILRCNAAVARFLNRPREELIRRGVSGSEWDFYDEAGMRLPEAEFPVNRVVATQAPTHEQVVGLRPAGSEKFAWFLVNAEPVFESKERLACVVCTFTDITEHKREESAHRSAEIRYRLLFNSSPLATWVYDSETLQILAANQAAIRQYGYTKDEFLALTARDLYAEQDTETLLSAVGDAEPTPQVAKHRRKDEQTLDARVTTQTLRYRNRDARLVIAEDITGRLHTERALKRLSKRISNILESIRDGFLTLDRQWQVTYLNSRAEQIMGRRRDALTGQNLWEVFPELRRAPLYKELHRAMQKQNPIELEHYSIEWGVWLKVNVFPSQDGLSIYLANISDRKRVEQELQDLIASLKSSVDGIVRAMSYAVELRDPYTAGHQRRVSMLVCAMARQMGLPPDEVKLLRVAALLHDIGKIAMPAEILSKPGNLSRAEMSIIQNHAQIGYDILKGIDFDPRIALVSLQHHERLDGSGYPNGLDSDEIIPEAKMMAVADVVEAMASHRPFRPSLGIEKALNEALRNKGVLYDPASVEACLAVFAQHGFDFENLLRLEEEALNKASAA